MRTYVNICTYVHVHFCLITVPSAVVEVTSIDAVEYGQPTTLECNVIAVRGMTSIVDIIWVTGFNYTIVRRVDGVTANIVNNSAVYTDQFTTPPLSVNDNGRVYYCGVSINTTSVVTYSDSIVLNFSGKKL